MESKGTSRIGNPFNTRTSPSVGKHLLWFERKIYFIINFMIHPDLERAWSSFAKAKKIVSISCNCYFNAAAVLNILIVIYFAVLAA